MDSVCFINNAADMLCGSTLQAVFYIRFINGKPKLFHGAIFLTLAAVIFFAPIPPVFGRLLLSIVLMSFGNGTNKPKSGTSIFFAVLCAGMMSGSEN